MTSETWKHIVADGNRFETFGHEAMQRSALTGAARDNYREAIGEDSPFDGETHGQYLGHTGKILFEFKSGTRFSEISKDLTDSCELGKGHKLCRAAEQHPEAVAYVLVLGKARPQARSVQKIRDFIREHELPFKFEVEKPETVRRWLEDCPSLALDFRPPEAGRTLAQFLDEVRQQGASVKFQQYDALDRVYVRPREFDQASQILRDQGIVFIIGPPHIGKTFTATFLLWHWYRTSGRAPKWLLPKPLGREPKPGASLNPLEAPESSIAAIIAPNVGAQYVTYLEDPFGRTSDEEVAWKYPEPERILLDMVQHVKCKGSYARVIVTSREEIFDKALSRAPQLETLVVRLDARVGLGVGSYSPDDRRNLLQNYAHLRGAFWAHDLPADALEAAESLTTPLAIELYCQLAAGQSTPEDRARSFEQANQELVKAFANEIARLERAPLALLLTAQVVRCSPAVFARVFSSLGYRDPVAARTAATQVLAGHGRVNIEGRRPAYVHPSYREAIRLAIRTVKGVNAVFHEVSVALAIDPEVYVRSQAAHALGSDFEHLDAEGRALCETLTADPDAKVRSAAASALSRRFEHLDAEGRAHLRALATDPEGDVRQSAAGALGWNFEHLDAEDRAHLQPLVADSEASVRWAAAIALASNLEHMDAEGRTLLRALATDPEASVRVAVACALVWSFEHLDAKGRALLGAMVADPNAGVRKTVASVLVWNFEDLEAKERTLLRTLGADPDASVREVARKWRNTS